MDIKSLENEMRSLASRAEGVVANADMTPAEKRAELEKIEADIKSTSTQIADVRFVDEQSRKYAGVGTAAVEAVESDERKTEVRKSLGERVVDSEQFRSVQGKSGQFSSGPIDLKTTLTIQAGSGAGLLLPEYQQSVTEVLFRRLTVADLMPAGTMSGSSLIYPKETSVTNAAAAVAEGGAKPGSTIVTAQVTENLTKIATSIKVSDEMLQDGLATASYINGRLVVFVKQAEESQLLAGSGSGANMTGLLNRSGLQAAVTGGITADKVFNQITAIRANAFLEPDGLVLHPTDWQALRLSKDSTGQYLGAGPFAGSDQSTTLWGLNVVVTPAITVGTALVGAFGTGAAQVFRKGGLTVEATNSNEDDFLKNLVAIRAEERLLLAVYRPGAFGTVTTA
jgi:HK97 family phage major capsid protein